jgi:TolA-binding protein
MTDPERISKRSLGLAAQLLQAGAEEQPGEAGMQRTLAALGVSAAVVTTASTAGAVAGTVKATGAAGAGGAGLGATAAGGAVKAVSATLLVKWIGIGVVGGIGLAGAAAVATSTAAPSASVSPKVVAVPRASAVPAAATPEAAQASVVAEAPTAAPEVAPAAAAPRVSSETSLSAPVLEVGAPLAAEVAFVDRARALLSAGQADQGLALLQSYEREFPEARLLPEVLFLRLETCDRLGRKTEARAAAQRLVQGFPKSPHASRARKLLAR